MENMINPIFHHIVDTVSVFIFNKFERKIRYLTHFSITLRIPAVCLYSTYLREKLIFVPIFPSISWVCSLFLWAIDLWNTRHQQSHALFAPFCVFPIKYIKKCPFLIRFLNFLQGQGAIVWTEYEISFARK
jgi:hypothetical protein